VVDFSKHKYRDSGGKMIDSELGEIPEGWRVERLGDVLTLEYGKPLKEEERSGSGFPVFGSNGIVGYHKEFLVTGDGIVVGRKGTAGSVIFVENNFYPIDTTFYVQCNLKTDKLFFHYLLLLTQDLERIGSDSAVPGLNRNAAYMIEVVIPPTQGINYFHQIVKPIFSKLKNNNLQIQTLSTLRDTLLPKLMRGEMRVKF
jgi:type I restriction enzyme S subunit